MRTLGGFGLLALGCTSDGPRTGPPMASGPPPVVSISLGFGESPLEGFVRLTPTFGSANWRYAVDIDEDGQQDHEGILEREIGFAYRFVSLGVHHVTATLFGPEGDEAIEIPLVVNDPEAVRVLNQRAIVDPNSIGHGPFEGITMDLAGRSLFVGDFGRSEIHRLDPTDLRSLAGPLPLPQHPSIRFRARAEGLAVNPSDSLLIVASSGFSLFVVAIPSLLLRRELNIEGSFFVHAIDDTLAMSTGSGLVLVDTRSGTTLRRTPIPGAWHFSVSPDKELVAVIARSEAPGIHLVSLSTFDEIARIDLSGLIRPNVVAFDPYEAKLYVMGTREVSSRFLLIDIPSRTVVLDMLLGPGTCGYCVANPTATASNGRFVAMEQGGGVYFIDTSLDLPRYYIGLRSPNQGMSVTASPIEDVFYLLRSDGLLLKVRIEES
jgi:sugar lactone lactonase YvrE